MARGRASDVSLISLPNKLNLCVSRLNDERREDIVMLAFQFWLFTLSVIAVSDF